MQKIILLLIIIFLQTTSFSQEQQIGGSCANEIIPFLEYPRTGTLINPKAQYVMAGINSVPIKLHILRSNSGITSFDQAGFMESFMELNQVFKSINVQFYLLPDIDYIDNTNYYDLNADQEEESLCRDNDVSNAVNLYVTNSIVFTYGFNAAGYAYYPSPIAASNRIFITNSSIISGGRTLTHEFGHYFNLLHTFRGNQNNDVTTRELVTRGNGANCTTTGDFLCDTPADPYGMSGATVNGCSYTGTLTDANGMQFAPQMTNTMSYYSEICGGGFSANQFDRLIEGFAFRNSPLNQYSILYSDPGVAKPTGLTASASQAGILLTYTDNAINEFGYIIERAVDAAGPFEPIISSVANVESLIDQDLLSNTTFYYRVRAANGIEYTNVASVTTGTFYCQPTYQQSCNDFRVIIEQFSIQGTALSNLNSGCSPNNYGKVTNMVADLKKGNSYTFTASATTTTNVPYYAQFLSIWADFDQNGFFDSDELIYNSIASARSSGMNPSVSALINIPTDAKPGLTTLRARSQYSSFGVVISPCDELVMGETEDYIINIISPIQDNIVAVTSISPLAVCLGNSITVGYNATGGGFLGNTAFVVQVDNGNGQFVNLPTQLNGSGSLTATIPTSLATGSNFNIRVSATNPSAVSPVSNDKLTVNAVPRTPTLTINRPSTTVCIGTSVSVNAVGCTGTVNWGNNQIGNPITLTINSPITLTATCTANGCTGKASAAMLITTRPLPSSPTVQIVGGKSVYCSGESVTLNATGCNGVVNWSNGLTGNSISFAATLPVSLSATCKIDGCESVPSASVTIAVNLKPDAPILSISGSTNVFCVGETFTLFATGCSGVVNWSNGSTGISITSTATQTSSFTAVCVVDGCESPVSNLVNVTVNIPPDAPVVSVVDGNLNRCPGDNVLLAATGCNGTVTWSDGTTGNTITVVVVKDMLYKATCTQNGCLSSESNSISFSCSSSGSLFYEVELVLKVVLEGPYVAASELMKTTNNEQGLLPGQTPVSSFGVPTAAGQPYNRIPWNYSGSESIIDYANTVVDWVLVSIKENENPIIYQTAALLHTDARIEILGDSPVLNVTQQYYIQIDHRNHLGIMSQEKLAVNQKRITHDFSAQNSYIKQDTPAFGQKLISGKYVMFVGDVDKSKASQHYDINFADILQLRNNMGQFGQYLDADLNLDADINFKDLIIWQLNNGKFSSVTY
jgi:hypothetical protein